MKRSLVASALGLACLATTATAQLYGLDSSTPGTVYSVNESTGAATAVVNVTGVALTSITDIEFMGGVAYACDVLTANGWAFGTIDLTTGAFTQINNQGGSANWWGLAADEANNLFYTVDINNNNDFLSITPTGTITTIGNTGIGMSGMTFDNNNGICYATEGGNLYTINTGTGAATLVGSFGVGFNNSTDLAYNGDTNTLYLNGSDNNLYTVNTVTGLATLVGSNGFGSPVMDGLGWRSAPVPEPASMAALAGGIALLLRRRKK